MKPILSIKLVVPFSDVDMMGHVNNARYLTYFEMARTEHLYSQAGKLAASDIGIIIARAEVDYKFPAKWRDELTINMRTSSVGSSSWVYDYEILNEKENKLVAAGKTVQVAYDYKRAAPILLTPELRTRLLQEVELTSG